MGRFWLDDERGVGLLLERSLRPLLPPSVPDIRAETMARGA